MTALEKFRKEAAKQQKQKSQEKKEQERRKKMNKKMKAFLNVVNEIVKPDQKLGRNVGLLLTPADGGLTLLVSSISGRKAQTFLDLPNNLKKSVIVDPIEFSNVLKSMEISSFNINKTETIIEVEGDHNGKLAKANISIKDEDPEIYNGLDLSDVEWNETVDFLRFYDFLKAFLVTASDDTRPQMRGVWIGEKYLASTNGHVLSYFEHKKDLDFFDFLVPSEDIRIMSMIDDIDSVKIGKTEDRIYVNVYNDYINYVFTALTDKFPPAERVIPNNEHECVVNVNDFIDSLRFIEMSSKNTESNGVRIKILDNEISLRANGISKREITFASENAALDFDVLFDVKNLLKILDVFKKLGLKEVIMKLNIELPKERPLVLVEPKTEIITVAMPLKD